MADLFRGRTDLTLRGERLAFYLTLIFALPAAGALGFLVHESIGVSEAALLVVIAMIYVTLSRGRLIGSSVRLHETQYPRVFSIVQRAAAALGMPVPMIFVREDYQVPIVALGLGDPYSLVFSTHWIEQFADDELSFLVGRELGHIAAGHTRLTSLLSANGNENALISLIFGGWLRRAELTCDRVGLLCCGSVDAAMRAIAIASFHKFGRSVDYEVFLDQAREIEDDGVLRLGEWLGAMPYATRRITAMREFIDTPLYKYHEERFLYVEPEPTTVVSPGARTVEASDCAGWWRRFWAVAVDFIVVLALVQTIGGAASEGGKEKPQPVMAVKGAPAHVTHNVEMTDGGVRYTTARRSFLIPWDEATKLAVTVSTPFWMLVYFVVLVSIVGQTPGMLVTGLRVVRTDFRRPSVWQTIWRYALAAVLAPAIVVLSPFGRIWLHDKASRTRLIKNERVLARAG